MENTEINNQVEKTKEKAKFDLRLFFAILTAGIVPVVFELLNAAAGDSIYTLASYLWRPISELFDLYNSYDSFTLVYGIANCLSSLPSLIFIPISVLITVTVCSLLLKSFTKGISAYGFSCIVFSIRQVLPTLINTSVNLILELLLYFLRSNSYMYSEVISISSSIVSTITKILDYSFYILCPVLIGLLLFLSEKFQRKKPDSKVKLTIKLILTGLVPVAVLAIETLETILALIQNSTGYTLYSVLNFINTNLGGIIAALLLLAGVIIFIFVFRDGKMFTATVFYTMVPYTLITALGSTVNNVSRFVDELAGTSISGITNIASVFISILLFLLITTLSFIFIMVLPAVKARKKELEEIKKAEESEQTDSMQEYLDSIRYGDNSTDYDEYFYAENDEDNNQDYSEISAEQYYSYE